MSTLIKSKRHHYKLKPRRELINKPIDMSRVAAIILGGGEGTRLFPLTSTRCKPAISFGGKYRLIDIPISNSINSKCLKIFVITQFLSTSLHQHISKTYHPGNYNTGFIELLSVEQKPKIKNWFLGTADAVRQNLEYFVDIAVDYFLILSGDQLYNINFQDMMRFARTTNADLLIASIPVTKKEAKRMGILKIDAGNRITNFIEKPESDEELKLFEDESLKGDKNKDQPLENQEVLLGSMGIYLFKRDVLFRILEHDKREDFGKHIIPAEIKNGRSFAYIYKGYWEDIGTVKSYYEANMALTKKQAKLNLYDENNPIFTTHQNLPGPKIFGSHITQSIIADGSIIEAASITHSILGTRTVIKKGTIIEDSYLIGNDYYTSPTPFKKNEIHYEIGENCLIKKAIIDKHVQIGDNVQLININNLTTYNSDDIYIRDGIIIVTRGASIPNGFIL